MTGIIFGLFVVFGLFFFSLVINIENKREMSASEKEAFDKIDKWSRGEYNQIITLEQIEAFKTSK